MKKASALTAALSGAQPAAPPSHPAAAKSGGGLLKDNGAFPCLAYARDGGDSGGTALADGLGALDLSAIAIVGSAPTHISANGVSLARTPIAPARYAPRRRGQRR